jgi:aspartate aminotransferase
MTLAPTPPAFSPSANIAQLRESATIAASARAKALKAQGKPIIDLGVGEPDFDTPAFIRDAAKVALDQGATRYTATEGILPLREQVARQANKLRAAHLPEVKANEVVVGAGTKQALFNAVFCLFGPGDDVLVPVPAWTSYFEMVALARANPLQVMGRRDDNLLVDAEMLARAATPRTTGLMLNSPCNPTAAVYDRGRFAEILQLAHERNWWVISDEIYRRLSYDFPAASALEVAPSRERLVIVDGVAKSYAMTGWRIGWAIAPRPVAHAIASFQSHTTSNPATVSQHAAVAALLHDDKAEPAIEAMVAEFKRRRDACLAIIAEGNAPAVVHPAGAFYLFLDVSGACQGPDGEGMAFAARLLEEHHVAAVGGEAFGAPGWLRMSTAAPLADVTEGLRRVIALWRAARAGQ